MRFVGEFATIETCYPSQIGRDSKESSAVIFSLVRCMKISHLTCVLLPHG